MRINFALILDRNVQAENDRALLVWKPTERLTDEESKYHVLVTPNHLI